MKKEKLEEVQKLIFELNCIIEVVRDSCEFQDLYNQCITLEYALNLLNNIEDKFDAIWIDCKLGLPAQQQ